MFSIRPCIETDLPPCGALLQAIYAEPPYGERWPESRATAYLESFFRMDSEGALVATDDGKIIGAVFGFSYPWHTGSVVFIQELFVAGQYRGKGIARNLVMQMVEKKSMDSQVALIVREGTVAAKFYEKFGLSKSTLYELRSGKIRV